MKDRLRSSQSSKNSQVMERSKYQSPQKSRDPQLNSQFHNFGSNEDLQYKLSKIFQEAGNRQERYINLIKQQEQKLKIQSQKYLQSLKQIKGQFLQFMNKNKNKEQNAWKVAQSEGLSFRKQKSGTNRAKSKQFNLKNVQNLAKVEGKQFAELQCKIICYYYMPLASDYVRYKIPQNLIIRAGSFHPNTYLSKDIRIIKQQDESDNLNSLLGKIPFQIATVEDQAIAFQFKIACNQEAINYYKHRQIQIQLINTQGMFVFAYAKLNLGPILFFQEQPSQWQIKPITFYSTISGQKVGEMSIKFGNKVSFVSKNEHYKIQSIDPINMDKLKPMINYEDQQSRMVQRISKFKNNTNSLLLGIGSGKRQAKAEEIFQSQNEKIILMHRKKKELQSIMQYKQSHKTQFMDKLFNEAIDRYYLNQCEIGCPKYLPFEFSNKDKNHKKLFVKAQIELKNQQKATASSLVQCIQLSILSPQQINILIRQQMMEIDKAKIDYQFQEQEQTLWAASGMTHTLFLKVLCLPLKQSLYKKQLLNRHYDAKLTLYDEYDQQVESFNSKIKIKQPSLQSKIYIHGYQHSESELEIPFGDDEKKLKKYIFTNFPNLQYKWNSTISKLNIRIPHQILGNKNYYLIVNDSLNLYQINSFELCTATYSRLSDDINLNIGEVRKFELQFSIDEKAKTQKYLQVENKPANKGKKGLEQVRVGFFSSKPEHCIVSCESQTQLVCLFNKIYTVDAKIQSFQTQINPQKILIHALDLDSKTILKQWLIQIKKQQQEKYKQTYRISCERGKTIKYKHEFMNDSDKQKTYRFYSNNLSILTLPQNVVSLISNQRITLELEFLIREIISDEDLLEPIKVIFTSTDGATFENYLFELNVRLR